MIVTITLTAAGADTGPFDIYTDADLFTNPIVTGLSKATLTAGYVSVIIPSAATIIRVQSTGTCSNHIDLPISGLIP